MEKNIINVRRPSGQIEQVDLTSRFPFLTSAHYEKICASTLAAGRGEVLGFASGGIGKEIAVDSAAFARSRRTYAAILGGSLNENDDTSNRSIRGAY